MSPRHFVSLAIATAIGLVATPTTHAAPDPKAFGAAECEPYAPDTTRAELTYSPNGIYNAGTTNEKVICVLVRDQDAAFEHYTLSIDAHYRVLGATAARLTCTLWLGSK